MVAFCVEVMAGKVRANFGFAISRGEREPFGRYVLVRSICTYVRRSLAPPPFLF